jgi:hypothetical protein
MRIIAKLGTHHTSMTQEFKGKIVLPRTIGESTYDELRQLRPAEIAYGESIGGTAEDMARVAMARACMKARPAMNHILELESMPFLNVKNGFTNFHYCRKNQDYRRGDTVDIFERDEFGKRVTGSVKLSFKIGTVSFKVQNTEYGCWHAADAVVFALLKSN